MFQRIHVHTLYSRHDANVDSMLMVFIGPSPGLAGVRNLVKHLLTQALAGRLPERPEGSHAAIA